MITLPTMCVLILSLMVTLDTLRRILTTPTRRSVDVTPQLPLNKESRVISSTTSRLMLRLPSGMVWNGLAGEHDERAKREMRMEAQWRQELNQYVIPVEHFTGFTGLEGNDGGRVAMRMDSLVEQGVPSCVALRLALNVVDFGVWLDQDHAPFPSGEPEGLLLCDASMSMFGVSRSFELWLLDPYVLRRYQRALSYHSKISCFSKKADMCYGHDRCLKALEREFLDPNADLSKPLEFQCDHQISMCAGMNATTNVWSLAVGVLQPLLAPLQDNPRWRATIDAAMKPVPRERPTLVAVRNTLQELYVAENGDTCVQHHMATTPDDLWALPTYADWLKMGSP